MRPNLTSMFLALASTTRITLALSILEDWEIPCLQDASLSSGYGNETKSIAIVGAGIAGVSAAFTLHELSLHHDHPPHLTLFDKDSTFGGRVRPGFVHGRRYPVLETGAFAFSEGSDWCMTQAVKDIGLELQPYYDDDGQQFGIWNGSDIVFRQPVSGLSLPVTWSEYVRKVWMYGLPFVKLQRMTGRVQDGFFWFAKGTTTINNLRRAITGTSFDRASDRSAASHFIHELPPASLLLDWFVQPIVTAKLTADVWGVSALDAIRAISPDRQVRAEGGHIRMLQRMLQISEADFKSNRRVVRLEQLARGGWKVYTLQGESTEIENEFDHVILTGPLDFSGIDISASIPLNLGSPRQIAARHVTHFSSLSLLDPAAFGRPPNETLPQNIIMSLDGAGDRGVYSITMPRRVASKDPDECIDEREFVYRVVSKQAFGDDDIAQLFGMETLENQDLVNSVQRVTWPFAFPMQYSSSGIFGDLQVAPGLYVTSPGEDVLRSMEMACRMGANAAKDIYYNRMQYPDDYDDNNELKACSLQN